MLIHVEVPAIFWLQANHWTAFAVIRAMRADDANLIHSMVFSVVSHQLADLFAAPLFAFLTRADVN